MRPTLPMRRVIEVIEEAMYNDPSKVHQSAKSVIHGWAFIDNKTSMYDYKKECRV